MKAFFQKIGGLIKRAKDATVKAVRETIKATRDKIKSVYNGLFDLIPESLTTLKKLIGNPKQFAWVIVVFSICYDLVLRGKSGAISFFMTQFESILKVLSTMSWQGLVGLGILAYFLLEMASKVLSRSK